MSDDIKTTQNFIPTGDATAFLPARNSSMKPITVIGTEAIRNGFDAGCIEQALNSRGAPGVTELVLNPDAHIGYGTPVGCVMVSPTHIYPGPVGVDIKCSMSLLQMDLPVEQIAERPVRRALINAIVERIPTGAGKGQRSVKKSRRVSGLLGRKLVIEGATRAFPAGHHALKGTKYEATGHPILLPGNPRDGSVVMVAEAGAARSCFSVNHGAGRALGRKRAIKELDQKSIDSEMDSHDILSNCRQYPKDEAPAAYKDFGEVLRSVEQASLARTVAKLKARFVIKDASEADD